VESLSIENKMAGAGGQEWQRRSHRAKLKNKIPIPHTMMEVLEIFARAPVARAAPRHHLRTQMIYRATRAVQKPIPGPAETHRKIALFPMRPAFVILIHTAEFQEQLPPNCDIARHHERSLAFLGVV